MSTHRDAWDNKRDDQVDKQQRTNSCIHGIDATSLVGHGNSGHEAKHRA